jgi:hypothetical protein
MKALTLLGQSTPTHTPSRISLLCGVSAALVLCALASAQEKPTAPPLWPDLILQSGAATSPVATASIPLPKDADPAFTKALKAGALRLDGHPVQSQTVAVWPGDEERPRRVVLRWLQDDAAAGAAKGFSSLGHAPEANAGWSFAYTLVEGNKGDVNWSLTTRNLPLEATEYEMYQLDLKHGDQKLGLRLGLRTDKRIYWWQFVRADFIQRGPVFDVIRAGGPIYNEEYTLQSDLYLVLYKDGVIEAYPHFISHMREGEPMDMKGIPVVAFDVPDKPKVEQTLDGSKGRFDLGACKLDLDYTVHMADKDRPGSLKTENDVVVLQPWLDQQIAGGMLVYKEGIPDNRIIHKKGTTSEIAQKSRLGEADRYYITTIGDKMIPKGVARSFRFVFALPGAQPDVARYQAPNWWHALAKALPTKGNLPTSWWAVPQALKVAAPYLANGGGENGPFEYGKGGNDGDGTQGAALLALGYGTDNTQLCAGALPSCYWRADIPIHHTDFTISEVPYFGWQWIVQPYTRFMSVIPGYWETGDPYLLETAELAADGYYRFYATNRPHRFVGRDVLPTEDMLDLYLTTGDRLYLKRIQRILGDARHSYDQPESYEPGHQSGAGPNGVARRTNYLYIPGLLSALHVDLLEQAGDQLSADEQKEYWTFTTFCTDLIAQEKWKPGDNEWGIFTAALLYGSLSSLSDHFPQDAAKYEALLNTHNTKFNMPDTHSGGRAYSWVSGALTLDAWAWGGTWENGELHLRPHARVLSDPRAPKKAIISTPKGPVEVKFADGTVKPTKATDFPVKVEMK